MLWPSFRDSTPLPYANVIPKESIHPVTIPNKASMSNKATATKSIASSSTTSSSACPSITGIPVRILFRSQLHFVTNKLQPDCATDCKPTSTSVPATLVDGPSATDIVDWACTEVHIYNASVESFK